MRPEKATKDLINQAIDVIVGQVTFGACRKNPQINKQELNKFVEQDVHVWATKHFRIGMPYHKLIDAMNKGLQSVIIDVNAAFGLTGDHALREDLPKIMLDY